MGTLTPPPVGIMKVRVSGDSTMELEVPGEEKKKRCEAKMEAKSGSVEVDEVASELSAEEGGGVWWLCWQRMVGYLGLKKQRWRCLENRLGIFAQPKGKTKQNNERDRVCLCVPYINYKLLLVLCLVTLRNE